MILKKDCEYIEIEEDETSQLENVMIYGKESDDEELFLEDDEIKRIKNKSFKFKLFKSLKKERNKIGIIITIIIIVIVFLRICYFSDNDKIWYLTASDKNEDINDKLRKQLCYTNDVNDKYVDWNNTTSNENAFIIMLTSETEELDNYYMYTGAIVYRLLYKEETRIRRDDVDVVVMVTEDVADWKLRGLHKLGAIIKRVDKILMDNDNGRWKNCYTKLHMFEMTEYKTIIYLDSDLFIKKNIEELFDLANEIRKETGREDFFGAVTDGSISSIYDHGEKKGMINAGLMIITPEIDLYNDLIKLVPKKELYNSYYMEQGLLSYYYADDNNLFNRTRYHIDPRYNAQWLSDQNNQFYDKVYVIHQKLGKFEYAKNQQVQRDIIESILEWNDYVNDNLS